MRVRVITKGETDHLKKVMTVSEFAEIAHAMISQLLRPPGWEIDTMQLSIETNVKFWQELEKLEAGSDT